MKNIKKVIFATFLVVNVVAYSQQAKDSFDAKVVGSIPYNSLEVTILQDALGCVRKTTPHQAGLFIVEEKVTLNALDVQNAMLEIVNTKSNEKVFATKNCLSENKVSTEQIGLKLPEGSIVTEIFNANGEITELFVSLPEGSKIIGNTSSSKAATSGGGISITCTCKNDGGCKPFTVKGQVGCLLDGCSNCTATTSKSNSNQPYEFYFIQTGTPSVESNLATLADTRPIVEYSEWITLPFVTNEEINSEKFKSELDKVISHVSQFGNEDIISTPLVIFGKKMLLNVPFKALENGSLYTLANGGGQTSCSGKCKDSKCTKDTAAMGQVTFCGGCDSGCTLSVGK